MPRSSKTIASLIALSILGATPALAQPAWQNQGGYQGQNQGWQGQNQGWDQQAFWNGAPTDLRQRVEFLQQRIDRGSRDGSLSRSEARDLNRRLAQIRSDARRGYNSPGRRDALQARMDDLGRQIRYQRRDGNDSNRFSTNYDATRYYRDDPRYTERRLTDQDEVYRGSDGRYYCKRNDGTTGLIVGAIGGGVLGNVIDGGNNRVGGTLIGGALGALLGRSIDRSSTNSNDDIRCR
jgi:hypothetical protein